MKNLLSILAIFLMVSFSGCALKKMVKLAQDQQITPSPAPLEVHADSVAFDISVVLPTKMLPQGKIYTIKPSYVYGDQTMELDPIEFKAEDFPNSGDVQPRITQEYVFAYEPDQNPGDLAVMGIASDPAAGKELPTPNVNIAAGLITTSTLAQDVAFPVYADHGYNNKEELIPVNVNFYFEQGRSNLRRSEINSDRGSKLEAFIAEKNVTRTVTITGTHSPEGAERINSDLAEDRAQVIEDFYRAQMKKYDYQGIQDSIQFVLKPVIENWGAFKDSLALYDGITDAQKREYLDIVNGPGEFEDKEDRLQKLSTYDQVFDDLYPNLRSAVTEILMVKDKKTDAEISILAKAIANEEQNADTLSMEELLYGATLTPSLSEKEAIYKAAIAKEDNAVAHNNLGATYIQMAQEAGESSAMMNYLDMAATQLEIAMKMNASPEVYANMASVKLMMGDNLAAYEAADEALSNLRGDVAAGVYGVEGSALVQLARYDVAIASLVDATPTTQNLFNRGLAQLLNGDFRNAMENFIDAAEQDEDFALGHYAAAIAAARMSNIDALVEHLKQAIELDASYKDKALRDLEFRNFVSNAAFTALMN